MTDEDGLYELKYIRTVKGAIIGTHKVVVLTREEGRAESLPERYSDMERTELQVNVTEDENEMGFQLKSK